LDPPHGTPASTDMGNYTLIEAAGMGYRLAHYANPIYQ